MPKCLLAVVIATTALFMATSVFALPVFTVCFIARQGKTEPALTEPALNAMFAVDYYRAVYPSNTWRFKFVVNLDPALNALTTRQVLLGWLQNGTGCDAVIGPGHSEYNVAIGPVVTGDLRLARVSGCKQRARDANGARFAERHPRPRANLRRHTGIVGRTWEPFDQDQSGKHDLRTAPSVSSMSDSESLVSGGPDPGPLEARVGRLPLVLKNALNARVAVEQVRLVTFALIEQFKVLKPKEREALEVKLFAAWHIKRPKGGDATQAYEEVGTYTRAQRAAVLAASTKEEWASSRRHASFSEERS